MALVLVFDNCCARSREPGQDIVYATPQNKAQRRSEWIEVRKGGEQVRKPAGKDPVLPFNPHVLYEGDEINQHSQAPCRK